MTRVYFALDESTPLKPKIVLRCCGNEASLTECELDKLMNEMVWLKNTLRSKRGNYYAGLVNKYKEIQHETLPA
jgi:hypothetical protein